ncbi:Mariner Mos1 transposase [Eumeta japonica]|uniref:Mariner Mos1 transposase n=1 Tax=Eumeta variegata TaxID=151549 RepID=A0A4C1V5D3_EUMVA|nr:Mariner Mos1 transposase [Eumeta japonica]
MNRVLICNSLLKRIETELFLQRLITGREKFITYDKNMRKGSCAKGKQATETIAKPGLTHNKLVPCIWWDWKGVIRYKLLPPAKTINSNLYCQQLTRLNQEIEKSARD